MSAVPRRTVRVIVALFLLSGGTLVSLPIDTGLSSDAPVIGPYGTLDPPTLTLALTRGQLHLAGLTASPEHEAALVSVAAEVFHDLDTRTSLSPGLVFSESWVPASLRLLHATAAMESATVVMSDRYISVRGITADAETLAKQLELLREV